MKNLIIKHNLSAFHTPEQFILHPYAKKCVVIYHVNLMKTIMCQYRTLLLGKLEAYSVLESMYLWLHITWITKESSQRRVLGQYMSLGRF